MFCHNCGSKLEENTIVCPKCGLLASGREYKTNRVKKKRNAQGLISLILAIISVLMCFNFMLKNISYVGMYTEIIERIYYALNLVFSSFLLSFVALIISSTGENKDMALNKCALFLSMISLFFVITEIVIVIVY